MVAAENRAGEVLASKYRLEELLGSGGMGHVYRATNELVGRTVAIKLLRPELATNVQVVERFLREARAANLVRHPNVVDVHDIGTDADGSPFIVQELLHGEDLARYAQRRGRLPIEEVVDLLCPAIDAVAEAHYHGVVHRDLKPENVFLARDKAGRVVPKLLDFGISKLRSANVRATEAGVMMGTPAYMAPEQLQGARDADARSDVWALGVMLFELLSGRLPFLADQAPALFIAIATKEPPKLSDVCTDIAPDVSRIVERCLRRKPEERYPTAAELARDLRHVAQGQDLEATGKRSVPPAVSSIVPDLDIPPPPNAPKIAPVPAPVPAPARAPAAAPRARVPSDANLPGVMLAPGAPVATRMAPRKTTPSFPSDPSMAEPAADMSWVVGLCAVVLVAIGAVAVLMGAVHRPDGWAFVRLVLPGNTAAIVAGQSAAAIVAAFIGSRYGRRAFRQWTGEWDGSRTTAVVNAAIAGAFFFAAIELVRGAW